MKKKPIIRHCMNCQWSEVEHCWYKCSVKYTTISGGRWQALLCRFFTKKENSDETDI